FGGNLKANLTYNGGPVISSAKVVFIFWGPSFSNAASPDYAYAQGLQAYRNQLGTTPEYNVITQYSGIQLSNLGSGTADWFDTSTPATNVTDALVQSKVNSYLASHTFDASAIYEVVIPSTSYSSSGSSTSCGGTNLQYCAYHGWIGSGASAKKYSIQPYPSCGGCQASGWTDVQNQEHFVVHETREAVTDSTGTGWTEGVNEADDKCAWTPAPFFGTGGYGYQYEWSNAAGGCVQSVAIVASPTCGESTCVSLGGAYISHFTGLNCTGGETYYTPYFSSDGIRRSWDGNGIAGSILRTATNMSYKDSSGTCTNAWPAGNTLSGFVAVYRSGTPPGTSCGESSCVALGGAYISHFTGKNCTGTESYYTPYFSSDGIRRSWNGSGNAGTVLRTVTNLSYKDSSGTCTNAWPSGNTLSGFVLIYR
ncbi:MAG TPA: hypothetical protein VGG20_04345, partial [Thermoanaerobaculia bacterium]